MSAQTVPAADTQLHVEDTPASTPSNAPALVLLNGGFGTTQNWNRVVARLGGKHRVIRFDARGRGKSGRSADYSLQPAIDDIGRVIEATGAPTPVILVGWSHGATLAVRYAAQHPDEVAGLVLVDGGYPIASFDEEGKRKVRAQFRRLAPVLRLAAALGRGARMSAAQAADLVIEMDTINGELTADFASLQCPAAFVVGTGGHSGAKPEEMATLRAAAADAQAANERVTVFATAPCNHVQMLTKGSDIVASAIAWVSSAAD